MTRHVVSHHSRLSSALNTLEMSASFVVNAAHMLHVGATDPQHAGLATRADAAADQLKSIANEVRILMANEYDALLQQTTIECEAFDRRN